MRMLTLSSPLTQVGQLQWKLVARPASVVSALIRSALALHSEFEPILPPPTQGLEALQARSQLLIPPPPQQELHVKAPGAPIAVGR